MQAPGQQKVSYSRLVDLRPSLQAVNVQFIVLEKEPPVIVRKTEKGHVVDVPVCTALVADPTAAVHLQLWGAEEVEAFQPSDIVRLTGGLFVTDKKAIQLRSGRKGVLEKIGEFDMIFTEQPNMSTIKWVHDDVTGQFRPKDPLPTSFWQPPKPSGP
ncbi:hypothetical protein WJX72_000261 [[Myrmecia] bisecta]|uniref:Uncharacterized protein n=1 Tax=[Myrmecia] bisecta TaxID=41462 RepID=A0AAW1R434_9CHLO